MMQKIMHAIMDGRLSSRTSNPLHEKFISWLHQKTQQNRQRACRNL